MTDIFDIKPNVLPFIFDINYSLIYILFVIFILIFFFLKSKKIPDYEIEKIPFTEEKIDFNELYQSIETHHIHSSNIIFYQKVKWLIVLFLEYKTKSHISQMTLSELNWFHFPQEWKELFKEIYFRQYEKIIKDDTDEYRKNLLSRLKIFLNTQ